LGYWTIIYELLCTNILQNEIIDNSYFKFNFFARYKKDEKIFNTSISINVSSEEICNKNNIGLSADILINTNNFLANSDNVVSVNRKFTENYTIIDNIGLLSDRYWNRKLSYNNLRKYCDKTIVDRTQTETRPRVVGIFPVFEINSTSIIEQENCFVDIELPIRNNLS